jgi:DNA replication protein DnaC
LVDELISNSPLKLQRIVRNLKSRQENNDLRRYIPHCIVLLGEPGVGKSTLAQAIAQYCSINSTIVELTNLHED